MMIVTTKMMLLLLLLLLLMMMVFKLLAKGIRCAWPVNLCWVQAPTLVINPGLCHDMQDSIIALYCYTRQVSLSLSLYLICSHDIGLHMGSLTTLSSEVAVLEGAFTADCCAHQLDLSHQARGQDASPVQKRLSRDTQACCELG